MTIIQMNPQEGTQFHPFQSQSHRESCWEDGYIAVPEPFVEPVYACQGYCELLLEDGVLTGVVPLERPKQGQPEFLPDDDRDSMLVDMSYRLTLLELGVN